MSGPRRLGPLVIGIVLAVVVTGGVGIYVWQRPAPRGQQGDPAVMLAAAVGALDRQPNTRLTPQQAEQMLPYLRVLRDTDAADVEASRALIDHIHTLLTPEQLATMRQRREQMRAQGPPEGGLSQGPPGGGAAGGDRTGLRRQILSRLIDRLQRRVESSS